MHQIQKTDLMLLDLFLQDSADQDYIYLLDILPDLTLPKKLAHYGLVNVVTNFS